MEYYNMIPAYDYVPAPVPEPPAACVPAPVYVPAPSRRDLRKAAKAQRVADKEAQAQDELERYGELVADLQLCNVGVRVYSKGYVRLARLFTYGEFMKLHSYSGMCNVQQKNGLGRAVGGILTQGWSLDLPDFRGSILLVLLTDHGKKTLRTSTPVAVDVEHYHLLEAVLETVV